MTYRYSKRSREKLDTCETRLQELFEEVIKHVDVTIVEGHRSLKRQAELYATGKSKVKRGKHNTYPSMAVDVAPYPIDWNDRERWLLFVGFVKGLAAKMDIPIRAGGDWDGDFLTKDQTFHDMPHFEIDE